MMKALKLPFIGTLLVVSLAIFQGPAVAIQEPSPAAAVASKIYIETAADGELLQAWYSKGAERVQVGISKKQAPGEYQAVMTFTKGKQTFLTLTAKILRQPTEGTLGYANLTAKGAGVDYEVSVDARHIEVTSEGEVRPNAIAHVKGRKGAESFEGRVDVQTEMVTAGRFPSLDDALSKSSLDLIQPLVPALKSTQYYYENKYPEIADKGRGSRAVLAGRHGHVVRVGIKDWWNRWKGKICRAGCWGTAAGGTAAVCGVTAGVGCAVAAGALGAAASICSDRCPT